MTFLREVEIVLAAYFTYFAVRGATEGAADTAIANAHRIEDFEQTLGIFIERDLQDTIVGHSLLVDAANLVYIWGHWPVIGVVALWLFTRRQPTYLLFRNAFLISGAIGLAWFWLFPVAPPRLAELGLVDTVVERSNFYRVLQPPQLTNQFAAFPSLHFGWNLLMGLALYRYATNRAVRAFGLLLPAAMFAAIVLTANHYIVDGVAGGAIALFGLWLAVWLRGQRDRRRDAAEQRRDAAISPPLAAASRGHGERPRRA
jgi:membrane-associated phospholipid phosphatase